MFATVLSAAILGEGIPLHLLLRKWSSLAAWICTALDLYGLLWAIALGRAARLRTILVNDELVLFRIGMLRELQFRRDNVAECRPVTGAAPPRREPGYVSNAIINGPSCILHLKTPVEVRSIWGQSRAVTRIGVAVDAGARFAEAIRP